jgi:ubiquitin C-terminal hydrolase
MEGHNKVSCSKCNAKVEAVVRSELVKFPDYLILTLSIFRYTEHGSEKVKKPFNFEFTINIKNIVPETVKEDTVYELYAFVLHMGTGIERGHYQCYARSLDENPMLWYNFDDGYVTEKEINQTNDFHLG